MLQMKFILQRENKLEKSYLSMIYISKLYLKPNQNQQRFMYLLDG